MESLKDIQREALGRLYTEQEIASWLAHQRDKAFSAGDQARAIALCELVDCWNQLAKDNVDRFPDDLKTESTKKALRSCWKSYKVMVPIWVAMLGLGLLGWRYGIDKRAITGGLLIIGLASHAFAWLVGVIMLIPFIGPLIIKILSIPLIWLLNAAGYLISLVAIKRGFSKDVLTYRSLTIAMITGIVVGYILGKIV
jgi:hypothetical protein